MKTIGFLMFLLIFNDFPIWKDENTYSRMLNPHLTLGEEIAGKEFGANKGPGNSPETVWERILNRGL